MKVKVLAAAAIVLVVLGQPRPASAQDRDTLWTKVTAEGRVVSLSWDKQHPWDAILTAQGATLMAKYIVQPRREVTEMVARATVRPGDARTVRFPLPESLGANPIGPVCLFVQLPDRRTLPIRRANAQLVDTAGFEYDAWDQRIRQRGQLKTAEETVAAARRAVTISAQSITNQEASVGRRGWSTLAACDTIPAPSSTAPVRPFDAVPQEEQDDAARRTCVRRVWLGNEVTASYVQETLRERLKMLEASRDIERAQRSLQATFDSAFVGPGSADVTSLLNVIIQRLGNDNATVQARQEQLRAFVRDWMRWSAGSKDYRPQFGAADDYLTWPSTATEIAFRIFGPTLAGALNAGWAMQGVPAASTRDLESFIGASLDSYAGCVDDGRKQLSTKWAAWQREQSSAPQFAASARDFLVRECRQEVGLLEKLKADRSTLEQQVARAEQALATASNAPPLSTKSQVLNLESCTQP